MFVELLVRFPRLFEVLLSAQANQPEIKFFTLKDPDPEPSLAWFILNAFFLVAVALAVTIAIGVAFGSFRFWLLEKFPHNPFNGVRKDEVMETLKLKDEAGSGEPSA